MRRVNWRFQAVVAGLGVLAATGCGPRPEGGSRTRDEATDQVAAPLPDATTRTVAIAAASDLKFALDEIVADFHHDHRDIEAQVTYGSSGNFYVQLSNGAPFAVFLSADIDYPRKLIEARRADQRTLFRYARGRIVVWVKNDSPLDLDGLGMATLVSPHVHKLAIANPRHAPYGRAAKAAIEQSGLSDQVADKLVLGENVAQAAQFVESGAADAGIIALSLALSPGLKNKGQFYIVPLEAYPSLEQAGIVLNEARDRDAAERFCAFMMTDKAQAKLAEYGFLRGGR